MAPVTALSDLARRAALHGGQVVRDAGSGLAVEAKGLPGDWVTEIDVASERAIRELLHEATPDIPMRGEESGGDVGDRYWLVDPLDGTTNFVHGFPVVGVSVALVEGGRPVAGCIHAPLLGDTYVAARGEGAWLERAGETPSRLSVSHRSPDQAVVGTGFPFRRKSSLPRYLAAMADALETFEDLRRPGAACLDLAWTAAGVFDGFFELHLAPWDVAAGGLLIEEAGGIVTDWSGTPGWLTGEILAGPPRVHSELLRIASNGSSASDA
jgi:myo-inositol-1(or 4)-monophosphatase